MNLFIPSELNWAEKGFRLRQETNFPSSRAPRLWSPPTSRVQLALRLRIPEWLDGRGSVKINGKPLEASAEPRQLSDLTPHLEDRRPRRDGPADAALRVEAMPDDPKTAGVPLRPAGAGRRSGQPKA